jgi:hypothetical protein
MFCFELQRRAVAAETLLRARLWELSEQLTGVHYEFAGARA